MSETDDTEQTQKNRREFIQQSAGLAAIGAATNLTGDSKQESAQENELFQPEEFWKDRMKQPDDGKDFGWFVDTRRCFGCHACEVSCKAENDVPLGNYIRQTFYQDDGTYPKVANWSVNGWERNAITGHCRSSWVGTA